MSIGSTLIHATDEVALRDLAVDLDALEAFPHVDLSVLTSLDFEVLVPKPLSWSARDPVVFDEEGGLAIARVQPNALAFLLDHEGTLALDDEQRGDLARIRAFVSAHGADTIYELATF